MAKFVFLSGSLDCCKLDPSDRRYVVPLEQKARARRANKPLPPRNLPGQKYSGKCDQLLLLLAHLCGDETPGSSAYQFVTRWLAYPLQHPGAKMSSALLFVGPEGTGKTMFFNVVRSLYGRDGLDLYAEHFESHYTSWAPGRRFFLCEGLINADTNPVQRERLKYMLTERFWGIQRRLRNPSVEEVPANFVFLAPGSGSEAWIHQYRQSRRFSVLVANPPLRPAFYTDVWREIHAGGIEALRRHLLSVNLEGFGAHVASTEGGQ